MDGGCLNFVFINPTFTIHYHRYEAPAPRNDEVDYDALYGDAFAQIGEHRYIFCSDRFADLLAREMAQARAYNHFMNSLLGFEATDHSDAPPYIAPAPTARASVCIDFGFEPTEASE